MSTKPDYFALLAALVTAVLHLAPKPEGTHVYFIVGACLFWIGFVFLRWRADRNVLRRWGFRFDNLQEASRIPLAFFTLCAVGFGIVGLVNETFAVPPHLALLLLLYPLWGIVQQFLVLGIVVGNLENVPQLAERRPLLVVLGAAVFGAVHAPEWLLVGGTTTLALLYVPLFLSHRNVLPLGVVHGWVGSLFYLWILGVDPWVESFG